MSIQLQDQFRVRAQLLPDGTVFIEPGLVAYGTQVQALGPFVLPISGNPSETRRIDRVVLDRGAGTVLVRTGNTSPPPLFPGEVPLARILIEPGATLVLDAAIVDERPLWPLTGEPTPPQPPPRLLRRVVASVGTEVGWPGDTLRKVRFENVGLTVGDDFIEDDSTFVARAHGYYQVTVSLARLSVVARARINTKTEGGPEVLRVFSNAFSQVNNSAPVATVSDILELQAGERIIIYGEPGDLVIRQSPTHGSAVISFLSIQRLD